nr:MAG TPA: hypothetical protein [Caudoviricetes sp.]
MVRQLRPGWARLIKNKNRGWARPTPGLVDRRKN